MTIVVGSVIAVVGIEVTIRAYENSNVETHFFKGQRFKGVSIREFIAIEHGFRDVVCIIEGEYLDERNSEYDGMQQTYVRKLKARPVGYFDGEQFKEGIKFLPKIEDQARLLSEEEIARIFESKSAKDFVIGSLLKEGIEISLPWERVFNAHLGIFGNTGSGKSNTLAKIYTVLFENKLHSIGGKSKFIFLDFNGEYTSNQFADENKKTVIKLSTKANAGAKFHLLDDEFWDAETLGILFQATPNTQKPFLKRVVSGRAKFRTVQDSLKRFVAATFKNVLRSKEPKPEALELLKSLARNLGITGSIADALNMVSLRKGQNIDSFHVLLADGAWKFLSNDDAFYKEAFGDPIDALPSINAAGFQELLVRADLQIIRDVLHGSAQYDHIHPLLRRIEAMKDDLAKVLEVSTVLPPRKTITVISLRDTKQEIKKILPILIAKHIYEEHKAKVQSPPDSTVHLVIDEAHNILSRESSREAESWKDYRLELFEEIIKEGRKFGMFITLASQRPADISPTIISQLHNFFIHRLVNDRDLQLLENTISTLDNISRAQIPSLPQGACVVTGSSFDIPMLVQVGKLADNQRPDSRDVDLEALWAGVDHSVGSSDCEPRPFRPQT
ncbi:ATP-binding protein (plasmid) [Rhizobium sp. CB3171]|uniref:ATP-binding protein n=1 Tax=Rhizobium sp. CB3171 TaxID=3039157 RepID=UPI0024B04ABE|nr:ATP-binding protein [Rhizobium sp. CB3171]WFU04501.1 ATP-binding protein [Rhizobium sp. CB3171]